MISKEFELATIQVEKVNGQLNNDELLSLYALFKIANNEDIDKADKPGTFDMKGKAKRNKWQEELDKGTTPAQAPAKYIQQVNKLKEKYGYDANRTTKADGSAIDSKKLQRFKELSA